MIRDVLENKIVIFISQVRKQWAKLTDDDLIYVEGRIDLLTGRIQKRYGMASEEASLQVQKWIDRIRARRAECLINIQPLG